MVSGLQRIKILISSVILISLLSTSARKDKNFN